MSKGSLPVRGADGAQHQLVAEVLPGGKHQILHVATAIPDVLSFASTTVTTTAKALGATGLTVPSNATHALVTVDGAAVRYRDDGTVPTTTAGLYIPDGSAVEVALEDLTDAAFIAVSGTANLNVSFRRYDA